MGRGLLYRFWISSSDLQDPFSHQLLYYGTDPFTPRSQLPLGQASRDFVDDVMVRISNPIGEYVQQVLSVKVSVSPEGKKSGERWWPTFPSPRSGASDL